MIINGMEINYISAQLKMACDLEERSLVLRKHLDGMVRQQINSPVSFYRLIAERHEVLMRKANYHLILAEDADEQRVLEEGGLDNEQG